MAWDYSFDPPQSRNDGWREVGGAHKFKGRARVCTPLSVCSLYTVNVRITAPKKNNYISPWRLNTVLSRWR